MDGSEHSVPTKEDFKAKIKSTIFIYIPIVGMFICLLMALVAIFGGTAYCTWTGDFSSLGAFAHFLGKLLATSLALLGWVIAMFIIKGIRILWGIK